MSLLKNTALLTGASIVQKAIALVYFIFLARMLGSREALGSYALALTTITTVGVIADLGMTSVVIREIARDATGKGVALLRTVFAWKLIAIPCAALCAYILPAALGFSSEIQTLVHWAIPIMIADTLSVTLYGVLRAHGTLIYESLGIFIGQLLTASTGTIALLMGVRDIRMLVLALLAGSIWNAIFSAYHVSRKIGWHACMPKFLQGTAPLRMASMFFLSAIFVKLYSAIDSFTIAQQLGPEEVGVYSVSYKMAYAFQFIPLAFVGALYPAMSAAHEDAQKLRKLFLDAQWYMTVFGCAVVFGLSAVASPVIHLFYGSMYASAVFPLQLLLIGVLFIFYDFPVGSLLNAVRKQHEKTAIMGVVMAVNGGMNLLFVPMYGLAGAGYAAIMTFFAMYALGLWRISRVISGFWRELVILHGKGIACGVVMVAVVWLVLPFTSLFLAVGCGAVTFVVASLVLGLVQKKHYGLLLRKS